MALKITIPLKTNTDISTSELYVRISRILLSNQNTRKYEIYVAYYLSNGDRVLNTNTRGTKGDIDGMIDLPNMYIIKIDNFNLPWLPNVPTAYIALKKAIFEALQDGDAQGTEYVEDVYELGQN